MRAQLIPLDGKDPIEVIKDLTVVGRKEYCDLRLEHKSVSKMHCILVKTDGLLLLRDLGSTNGTRVNGQRVRRTALLPSDQLAIAHFKFRVYLGPGEAPVAMTNQTQEIRDDHEDDLKDHSDPDASDLSAVPIKPNALPDLYSDDEPKGDRR